MYYMLQPTSNDLYHHGILGQKWGRKNGPPYPLDGSDHSAAEKKAGWRKSLSVKAAGHKALAKVYGMNEKTYARKNPTLSSMNRAAKEEQLKKAEEAQKVTNRKKLQKIERYRDKLYKKSQKAEQRAKEEIEKAKSNLKDLYENKDRSKIYKDRLKTIEKTGSERDYRIARLVGIKNGKSIMAELENEQLTSLKYAKADGKKYLKVQKDLLKMPITEMTTKKDIRNTVKKSKFNADNKQLMNDRIKYIEENYGDLPETKNAMIKNIKRQHGYK